MTSKQNEFKNVLGIVMCGGMSSRMGTDKGLMKQEGKYWAEIIAEKFSRLGIEYVFSINASQKMSYHNAMGYDKIFIEDNQSVFQGPLKGLMSVHEKYSDKNLIPIACDMIFFKEELLASELVNYTSDISPNPMAFKRVNSNFFETFGAIYTVQLLSELNLENETSKDLSLQKLLNSAATHIIATNDSKSFINLNAPKDLF